MKLQRHPLSALFAQYDLDEQRLDDLAADIKAHGQREAIKLYEGQVLDGWNRYCAAGRAKVEPITIEIGDDEPGFDPWKYVLSANVLRRHLTAADIAAVYLLKERNDPNGSLQGGKQGNDPNGSLRGRKKKGDATPSVAAVAEELGVSYGTAQRIQKIKTAAPEVQQAVIEKTVSLDDAAKIAKLPKDQQAKAIKSPKKKKEAEPPALSAEDALMAEGFGEVDPMVELERVTNDYQRALRTIAALQTDDATRQIATLSDTVAGLEARLADKMAAIDHLTNERAKDTRILGELCKLLEVDHPKKLVATVKSFKKEHA